MAIDAWTALRADLARGREQAFAELYDRCAASMHGVALRMLGSDADAEDAVHTAFLDLLRSRRALARAADPRAYAVVAARNAALRLRNAASRRRLVGLEEASLLDAPEALEPGAQRKEWLARAVEALPEEQRDVIALKVQGELTFAQIGEALGISPNTASSRYRYALERLRASSGTFGGARPGDAEEER